MKKQLIIIFLLCLSVKGISQIPFDGSDSYATPPIGFGQGEFENPLINSINREPYGATSISFLLKQSVASETLFLLPVSVIEWNMEV